MQKRQYNAKAFLGAALLVLICPCAAHAQSVVVNDDLTFGHVSIRDNSVPRDIQLLPTGNYVADPEYVFYSDEPALGSISISGQPPSALMDVTIDLTGVVVGPSGGGGGTGTFTLVNPFTVPPVIVTSPAGTANFQIGGTLRSDGSGLPFLDNSYLGIFSVSVAPN